MFVVRTTLVCGDQKLETEREYASRSQADEWYDKQCCMMDYMRRSSDLSSVEIRLLSEDKVLMRSQWTATLMKQGGEI